MIDRVSLSAALLALPVLFAAPLHAAVVPRGGDDGGVQDSQTLFGWGIQKSSIDVDVESDCVEGEAPTEIDVSFEYVRGPLEVVPLPWIVQVWEKDAGLDDLVAVQGGVFPATWNGGEDVEHASVRFDFDSCPILAKEPDGCAEYYVVILVLGPNPLANHFESTKHDPQSVCCEGCEELAIELVSFQPTVAGSTVLVTWSTASEVDNAGFRVSRAPAPWGPWTPIHSGLVPALGAPAQGETYQLVDANPKRAMPWYRLEDVDVFGKVTEHSAVPLDGPWAGLRL